MIQPLNWYRMGACGLLISVALAGCSEDPPAPIILSVSELPAPSGADSGQPFLSQSGDTVLMSWIERAGSGERQVRFARLVEGAWDTPVVVAEPERLLVNVADFPSVLAGPRGSLWAHWPERDAEGFGYSVRVSHSRDGGARWSESWTPHEDGTSTEHGFVTTLPMEDGVGILWLDGRNFEIGRGGAAPTRETGLYFRSMGVGSAPGPETLVDARVCDCCQTDGAVTSSGPVAVYRDRSPTEIRDIYVTRFVDGRWTEGSSVHEDGWETGACPVNGPAVAARGDRVATAWFTAAAGVARVYVAFSDDAAASFRAPIRIDHGDPAGRVDVVLLGDGSALVSWVEHTGGEGAEARIRRVGGGGQPLEGVSVTAPFTERVVGFPRLVRADDGTIILAWTDGAELTPRVRVTRIEVEES